MLPQPLLVASTHLEGERIVPHYLSERDEPWLGLLLQEYRRFAGRKCSELREHLRKPLATRAPKIKLQVVMHVLDALSRARPLAAVPPKELRASLFRAAAQGRSSRDSVLHEIAASFAVSDREIESALFADLRSESTVAELPADCCPPRLVAEANLAIVGSLIRRARQVRFVVWGDPRALLRKARFVGLICTCSRAERTLVPLAVVAGQSGVLADSRSLEGVTLDVSGPLALFQHTGVYGRALVSLLPHLAHCGEFVLTATCSLGHRSQRGSFRLDSEQPIATARELGHNQRRVEVRFERDFRLATPDWQLLREPAPLASGNRLIFPDFELVHRHDPTRRWLLEIVGFWTREYLLEKLSLLRAAGVERLVLCIDQNRPCTEGELPPDAKIVVYKARIDPRAVLAIIDAA